MFHGSCLIKFLLLYLSLRNLDVLRVDNIITNIGQISDLPSPHSTTLSRRQDIITLSFLSNTFQQWKLPLCTCPQPSSTFQHKTLSPPTPSPLSEHALTHYKSPNTSWSHFLLRNYSVLKSEAAARMEKERERVPPHCANNESDRDESILQKIEGDV